MAGLLNGTKPDRRADSEVKTNRLAAAIKNYRKTLTTAPNILAAANKAIAFYPPENKADTDPIRARIKLFQASQPYRKPSW